MLTNYLYASYQISQDEIFINTKNLTIANLITIVSKITNKTILSSNKISGSVNITQNKFIKKDDIIGILEFSLNQKGYELIVEPSVIKIQKRRKIKKIITKKKKVKSKIITKVITLKNAKASNMLKILTPIVDKKSKNKDTIKTLVSSDNESNSIVMIGSAYNIKNLENLIKNLDKQRMQVYVEAKILEISENKSQNIGVTYGLSGLQESGSNLLSFSTNLSKTYQLQNTNNINLSIPNISNAISLAASINLLKSYGALEIISQPSILCLNNKESSIYIGETKSIKTDSKIDSTGTSSDTSFSREDIGLKLSVNPRILSNNKTVLDIQIILEDVRASTTNGQPDTSKKEIKTTTILNSGESIIIGGLTKIKTVSTEDKIPVLGDIPILGNMFKDTVDSKDKINLVIIMTPYIIPKTKDLSYVVNELAKLQAIQKDYSNLIKLTSKKRKNYDNKQ